MIRINPDKLKEIEKSEKERKKYFLEALKILKEKKEMSFEEYSLLIPVSVDDEKEDFQNKFMIPLDIEMAGLSESIYRISPEGEKFLKENEKSKP